MRPKTIIVLALQESDQDGSGSIAARDDISQMGVSQNGGNPTEPRDICGLQGAYRGLYQELYDC